MDTEICLACHMINMRKNCRKMFKVMQRPTHEPSYAVPAFR